MVTHKKENNTEVIPSLKRLTLFCFIIIILFCGTLFFYNKAAGIIFFLLQSVILLIFVRSNRIRQKLTSGHFLSLYKRVKSLSENVVEELPMGVILYGDNFKIEWVNKFVEETFNYYKNFKSNIGDFSEPLLRALEVDNAELPLLLSNDKIFKVTQCREHKLLYIGDVTERTSLENKYLSEKTVICMLYLDNFDDAVQGMDDQNAIQIQNLCTSKILYWGKENNFLLRRIESDRFIGVLNDKGLAQLERQKFDILDIVRESTAKEGSPITLSIGVGSGAESIIELGQLAQTSLDLALGRGGDQVVIKTPMGKSRFYGGKSNPLGKRARVRARVISHALSDLIIDSDHTIIMGHKIPDMDVYGSAIGLLQMIRSNNRKGFIVREGVNEVSEIGNFFTKFGEKEDISEICISPEEAHNYITENTLLIVIDTHSPTLVIDQEILNKISKVVVIDHHRRGEEIIQNPLLAYIEPYASSTAELVSELIDYHDKLKKMDKFVATALLAGIIVDTKSFAVKTGVRTFDAASYLRLQGADLEEIQELFKENIDSYLERNKLIENNYFYKNNFVISYVSGETEHNQVQIAKAADTLLTLEGVNASFVVARNKNKTISISARSKGEINVQLVMEKLGGGGHMHNAAVQISGKSIETAVDILQNAIDCYIEGGKNYEGNIYKRR